MSVATHDSGLLGRWTSKAAIEPFVEAPDIPWAERTTHTPCVYFGSGNIAEYRPGVDYIAGAGEFGDCAVVMRQANLVYAGVAAHPDEWSSDYRELLRRVSFALARRPVEDLEPIIVERQLHPPGTVELELAHDDAYRGDRTFYLRLDRPTALTVTLEHSGSNAMMLLFRGGKKQLHWTREDTATGATLTIAVNVGAAAIEAVGHRYWVINVWNYDRENTASARLTVAYNMNDSEPAILPMPGNASFEYLNRHALELHREALERDASALERIDTHAPSLDAEALDTARLVTAREHGFETWEIVTGHVVFKPVFLGGAGEWGAQDFFDRGRALNRDSFSVGELVEFAGDFSDDLIVTLTDAFARAGTAGHGEFTGEHVLLALLDNPIAAHVLKSVGGDLHGLRADVTSLVEAMETNITTGPVQVSRELCGAVYRANFISVLGREGTNAGNLLAGLYGENGPASERLAARGFGQQDVLNYVVHGVCVSDIPTPEPGATVFDPELEQGTQGALSKARISGHEHVTIEHLLLALLDSAAMRKALASLGAKVDELRGDLTGLLDVLRVDDAAVPEPTRAFNRVMQMTVAKARRSGRAQASCEDALWALCGERDVPSADVLQNHGVNRSGLETIAIGLERE
ncbi:MAG: hypothetical protein F4X98_04295 [Gammaproteobacteria bacterium]|nr:hypothetical protein [Gammaproteobacteria bacterium]